MRHTRLFDEVRWSWVVAGSPQPGRKGGVPRFERWVSPIGWILSDLSGFKPVRNTYNAYIHQDVPPMSGQRGLERRGGRAVPYARVTENSRETKKEKKKQKKKKIHTRRQRRRSAWWRRPHSGRYRAVAKREGDPPNISLLKSHRWTIRKFHYVRAGLTRSTVKKLLK